MNAAGDSPDPIRAGRAFLKDTIRGSFDFSTTDQSRGVPMPSVEKPCRADAPRVKLTPPDRFAAFARIDLLDAIARRRSHRQFKPQSLTLDETSFLLWAAQGLRPGAGGNPAFRTVPSAGARHAFETYLCAMRVDGLEKAIYRYLPVEHELVRESAVAHLGASLVGACFGQMFVGRAAAVFAWTAVPYRMEWRYGLSAHRVIPLDAGHVCQNLYLACEAVGCGACAVAAYDQRRMDELLGVDGEDEFTLYLAPVGKVGQGEGQ